MFNDIMTFSNDNDVVIAVKDYFNDYAKQHGQYNGYVDNTISFAEKENNVNKLMMSAIKDLSGVNFGSKLASIESYAQNPNFRWAAFAVRDALIDMVLPDFVDRTIGVYTETRSMAMGDSIRFDVEDNNLFYVAKAGRNQRTTEFQREDVGQRSIMPINHNISVSVNWYKVVCGKESLAKFLMKAVMSIDAAMTKEAALAFTNAMSEVASSGAANLKVAGYASEVDDSKIIKLVDTVSAYNNSPAIFMGTKAACHKLLPKNAATRIAIDSDYVKLGYLNTIFDTDVMVMQQYADYGSNDYKLVLPDDKIYVISPAGQKPVKLVLEGNTYTRSMDTNDTADLTSNTTLNISWGIGVITNNVAGVISL